MNTAPTMAPIHPGEVLALDFSSRSGFRNIVWRKTSVSRRDESMKSFTARAQFRQIRRFGSRGILAPAIASG